MRPDKLSIFFLYVLCKSITSSFFFSITQSNLLKTAKGKIILPYSCGLNSPLNTSSGAFQIIDDKFSKEVFIIRWLYCTVPVLFKSLKFKLVLYYCLNIFVSERNEFALYWFVINRSAVRVRAGAPSRCFFS